MLLPFPKYEELFFVVYSEDEADIVRETLHRRDDVVFIENAVTMQ